MPFRHMAAVVVNGLIKDRITHYCSVGADLGGQGRREFRGTPPFGRVLTYSVSCRQVFLTLK